jgi:membrane protease subunit (stomatin/prohibitin family)
VAVFDRIKFDGLKSRDWIVYKYPSESIVIGSQLVVGEGQVAIFVRSGRVCDVFDAGTYTLDTNNLPILQSFFNMPFGGKTPFTAEIYYINIATKLDILWGTVDPIQIIDPKYFTKLRVRAFGQFGLRIVNYPLFFTELIGSMNLYDIVKYEKVLDFYKGLLITKVKTVIADIIVNHKISALEITAKLDEISKIAYDNIHADFERYGFNMINFYIQSINFPDEDFQQINKLLEDRAAFEIMGDNRYVAKRSLDVYETAAGNENGVAGAFAAGGVGIGAGAALASNIKPTLNVNPNADEITCTKCGMNNPSNAKFCSSCGSTLEKKTIICPHCNSIQSSQAKFCSECGTPLTARKCECGAELKPSDKFCPECGKKAGE